MSTAPIATAAFADWIATTSQRIEKTLDGYLPTSSLTSLSSLTKAMRYAVMGGGKRIRPLLCHGAGVLGRAQPEDVDASACAVEMIHCYSLVHDDLPSMDDDKLRRGQPTCHMKYGEGLALLAGDSLHSLAFEVLLKSSVNPARQSLILAQAAGWLGMAGGQAIDLASDQASIKRLLTQQELEDMHSRKTGSMIHASLMLGLACGPDHAHYSDSISCFGKKLGLLFQIVDDILDASGTTEQLGKTAGKDQAQAKSTYVTVLGLVGAQALADDLCAETLSHLASLGALAEPLRQLTLLISQRHA